MLSFGLVVDARLITPAVGGKEQSRDVVEFAIRGCTLGIARAVGLAAPSEIAFSASVLMLHVAFAPTPKPVEDVLLVKLHSNHHAVRHSFCANIVVLDVGDIAQRVTNFEVNLVGSVEHIVKYFADFRVDVGRLIAYLNE